MNEKAAAVKSDPVLDAKASLPSEDPALTSQDSLLRYPKASPEQDKDLKALFDGFLTNVKDDEWIKLKTNTGFLPYIALGGWIAFSLAFIILILTGSSQLVDKIIQSNISTLTHPLILTFLVQKFGILILAVTILIPSFKFVNYLFQRSFGFRDLILETIVRTNIFAAIIRRGGNIDLKVVTDLFDKKLQEPDTNMNTQSDKALDALTSISKMIVKKLPSIKND